MTEEKNKEAHKALARYRPSDKDFQKALEEGFEENKEALEILAKK